MRGAQRRPSAALRRLAALYGVQTAYIDVHKRRQIAGADSLLAALRMLGAPLAEDAEDAGAAAALREREQGLSFRLVDPVIVAWDGYLSPIPLPAGASLELSLEDGHSHPVTFERGSLQFPEPLPPGYHTLIVRSHKRSDQATIISAPRQCYIRDASDERSWGTFIPLHAINSQRNWGAGDFTDLRGLAEWTGSIGGAVVGTLPLLSAFLDEPFEPSPYSPASRLFWNEFYIDAVAAPEFAACEEAHGLVESPAFQQEVDSLRRDPNVDYLHAMALKRRVLSLLARVCEQSPGRGGELKDFVKNRPEVADYAAFRAVVDGRRESWPAWPERLHNGDITEADFDKTDYFYHLYGQFLAHEQLSRLRDEAASAGVRVYLDLPLGTNAGGYDVWRERDQFGLGLSTGAPPDAFFTLGQDWGFPPPHPENTRRTGYRYLRAVLQNLLQYAGALRIDHVLGLHRLYCIPHGMDAREGVYIRYPADEIYAVLSLESHRHKAIIVGEDLGTVPEYVHRAMDRHAVHRTFVLQYELAPADEGALPIPPAMSVAALNTHDMPPFAAFWRGLDIDDRLELGLLTVEEAAAEHRSRRASCLALVHALRVRGLPGKRDPDTHDVLRAILSYVARSPARLVVINIEDLWLETRPQNVPGTVVERVNWRRKARYSLEQMVELSEVVDSLKMVNDARSAVECGND